MTQSEVDLLAQKLDRIAVDLDELKGLARTTNGRVTQLERDKIAREAAQAERQRMLEAAEEVGEKVADRRNKWVDRAAAAGTGSFCVVLGALLGYWL